MTRSASRAVALAAALALVPAAAPAAGEAPRETPMPDAAVRNLLAAGGGATVAPDAPARLTLPRERLAAAAGGDVVTLSLTPTAVAEEAFLVSVVTELPDGTRREIATFAFFPPPREGIPRSFPLDLSGLPQGEGPLTLEVRLVPLQGALEGTRLRVEGVTAGE